MAFTNPPRTWNQGLLITPAIANQEWRDQFIALYAGAMSVTSQAANDLIYCSSATQLARIASAASSVLVTNGSSVPSLSTSLPGSLTIPSPAITGVATVSTAMALGTNPATTGPIRLANNGAVVSRDSTNSLNRNLIQLTTADVVLIDGQ